MTFWDFADKHANGLGLLLLIFIFAPPSIIRAIWGWREDD